MLSLKGLKGSRTLEESQPKDTVLLVQVLGLVLLEVVESFCDGPSKRTQVIIGCPQRDNGIQTLLHHSFTS